MPVSSSVDNNNYPRLLMPTYRDCLVGGGKILTPDEGTGGNYAETSSREHFGFSIMAMLSVGIQIASDKGRFIFTLTLRDIWFFLLIWRHKRSR